MPKCIYSTSSFADLSTLPSQVLEHLTAALRRTDFQRLQTQLDATECLQFCRFYLHRKLNFKRMVKNVIHIKPLLTH